MFPNLNPTLIAGLTRVAKDLKDLQLSSLTPELLTRTLETLGLDVSQTARTELLRLAAHADGSQPIMTWATELFSDGTLARLVAGSDSSTVLHRCVFCEQPQVVPKPDINSSIMHRCVFCDQPNTVTVSL